MKYTIRRIAAGTALTLAAAGAGVGAFAASPAGVNAVTAAASTSGAASSADHGGRAPKTELTGDTLAKVKAAVLAANPGATIEHTHAETENGAAYEAHIVKADGSRAEVTLDSNFAVLATAARADGHEGRGGHGGPGAFHDETPLDSATSAKVKAAVLAALPGSTVEHAKADTDSGGAYEAFVKKSDGTLVRVTLDKNFTVLRTETFAPRAGTKKSTDKSSSSTSPSATPSASSTTSTS
jgi:uncharacterized membrane protein YkoI